MILEFKNILNSLNKVHFFIMKIISYQWGCKRNVNLGKYRFQFFIGFSEKFISVFCYLAAIFITK